MNTDILRKEKLSQRDGLSKVEVGYKSSIIQKKVLQLKRIIDAENIFIYVNFRSEVETLFLIKRFLSDNKKISVPITHVHQKRMEAVYIEDIKKDLTPGYCGILEPTVERIAANVMPPEKIDVVIVPGSVFDKQGGRFGYGGGYYDRFLEKIPSALRVGLAFDLQIVKEIPLQKHDEILDLVISEKRTIAVER